MVIDSSTAPTLRDLELAHLALERAEPRSLFYKAALELVELALDGRTTISVAEALAVLLQTWNAHFYRFRPFDAQHFADIEQLATTWRTPILHFRPRQLETLAPEDEPAIREIFGAFEQVLGPDGTAKCLHLLAPHFFPMWDHAIAKGYGLRLGVANAGSYLRFMHIMREQSRRLGGEAAIGRNPLKAIDEYNYCKCARKWL